MSILGRPQESDKGNLAGGSELMRKRGLTSDAASGNAAAPTEVEPPLWAVNVLGPDDLYAMASEAHAMAIANEWNLYFAKLDEKRHEYDPIMRAVAIRWPGTAESHAASLAKVATPEGAE